MSTSIPTGRQNTAQSELTAFREAVQEARASGDVKHLGLALADLGMAFFRAGEYKAGLNKFNQAERTISDLNDPRLTAHCLSIKAMAYEEARRFHTAYDIMNAIIELADSHNDAGMKCDALITQARILVNSGEPVIGLQTLKTAHELIQDSQDERRLMQVFGALGSLYMALSSHDQALTYFDKALQLADDLGEKRDACELIISQGTVHFWAHDYAQAIPAFEAAISIADELAEPALQITAIRYLVESLIRSALYSDAANYARRGVELAKYVGDENNAFALYDLICQTLIQTNQLSEVYKQLNEAIAFARETENHATEVDLLISLGETYMTHQQYQSSFDAYQLALEGAKRLQRFDDIVMLTGRLGVVFAEQGKTEQAIGYHSDAASLARKYQFPAYEGEQLCMLALAHLDREDVQQAVLYCQQAIETYQTAKIDEGVEKARTLLSQITAAHMLKS